MQVKTQQPGQSYPKSVSSTGGRFSWQDKDDAPTVERTQLGFLAPHRASVITYGSGASAKWDFAAYVLVNLPVGITATETKGDTAAQAIKYLMQGGRLFVDSGAFGAFRAKRELDFEREVFPLYDQLVDALEGDGDLLLAAPDVVGDQDLSLAMQARYAERMRRWTDRGARMLIPIQSGHMNPSATYRKLRRLMGPRGWVVGIPSNEQAWKVEELRAFVESQRPTAIHLLGMSRADNVKQIAELVHAASTETAISCDACSIIAHVGTGRRVTDRCRSRLQAAMHAVEHGTVECGLPSFDVYFGDLWERPGAVDKEQAEQLASQAGLSGGDAQAFKQATMTGLYTAQAVLDRDEEWLEQRIREAVLEELYRPMLSKHLSGPIRAWELARVICGTDPDYWRATQMRGQDGGKEPLESTQGRRQRGAYRTGTGTMTPVLESM